MLFESIDVLQIVIEYTVGGIYTKAETSQYLIEPPKEEKGMLFSVTKNKVVLSEEEKVNEGEYKATSCQFEFDDVYTGLVIKAVFTNSSRGSYEVPILDDRCDIPAEVLQSMGNIKVGVYGYEVDGEELVLRYSPSPTFVKVDSGSYVSNPMNPEEITPTQFEQYMQAMNDGLEEVENVNIDATKEGHTATVTITNRDGQTKSVEILDGSKGDKGDTGPRGATGPANTLSIGTVQGGDTAAATITGTAPNQTLNLTLPKGDKGEKGDTGPRGYTNVSAGNAIQIDTEDNNRISADIYPADFFIATDVVFGKGTTLTLNNTMAIELDSVEICGDMNQNGTPTPDTPVNINVVTGEQTITVSDGESQSQSYTVDLGSIELCKIGDYQDYIYKSGDDWHVHKEIGKVVLNGSETWSAANMTNNWMYYTINAGMTTVTTSQMPNIISNYFSVTTTDGQWTSVAGSKSVTLNNTASPNTQIRFTVGDSTNKLADFKTWLSTHSTTVYYALATPTDTKITDSLLIDQLEALAKAQAYDGQTNIGVTASGTNLSAILSVNGYRKSLAGMTKAINYLMSKAE